VQQRELAQLAGEAATAGRGRAVQLLHGDEQRHAEEQAHAALEIVQQSAAFSRKTRLKHTVFCAKRRENLSSNAENWSNK
jgi:hypothetical protein